MYAGLTTSRYVPWALAAISALVAVLAYLQALHYPFISDDNHYLVQNSTLAALRWSELWRLLTAPYNYYLEYLPLRDLSYWFDLAISGLNPAAFRLHNILLYLLCLPLIYAVTAGLWRYFRPGNAASARWPAAAVTALFALHPAHVESVVWISGRKDVLSTLFSMMALALALNARREYGLAPMRAAAALAALLAALLSKAAAVAVAPVVALLWLGFWLDIPAPQRRRRMLWWPLGALLLAAAFTLFFSAASGIRGASYFGIEAVTRVLAILGWLVRLAITPQDRHFFYPVFEDPWFAVMVALGLAVLLSAGVGLVLWLRRRSLPGFAAACFLLLSLPYIQLIPYNTVSLVADRFLVLAIWPVIMLIVALAWRLPVSLRAALLLLIALSWGYQTVQRPNDWKSPEALVEADLRAFPGWHMPAASKIMAVQLPYALDREAMATAGTIADAEMRAAMTGLINVDTAVRSAVGSSDPRDAVAQLWEFEQAHQLPAQAQWNTPIKMIWLRIGDVLTDEWRYLARKFPADAAVRYNTGLWMLGMQKNVEAIADFRAAAESPQLPETASATVSRYLGLALLRSGRPAEAEAPLLAALQHSPADLQAYCALAEVYRQTGRDAAAAGARADCLRQTSKPDAG
ncbi:MAG: hypothetical protein V4443_10995 [Pseudomonadota bacterium]